MPTRYDSYSGDGNASDPYTEARWEDPDRERRAWLDDFCRRELEIQKAQRAKLRSQGKAGGSSHAGKPLTRTHARRGDTGFTYCGRRIGDTRSAGVVLPSDLHDAPTCQNCATRVLARRPATG